MVGTVVAVLELQSQYWTCQEQRAQTFEGKVAGEEVLTAHMAAMVATPLHTRWEVVQQQFRTIEEAVAAAAVLVG
ncbi:hypothetical protein F6X56_15210 [Rhodococcus erythropolis]|uniref:hypothetical protein n=1 Tax=Rhodococcus erythropolis TaxID=1833 RepID=UPI001245FDCC|nr:hypothetical protein [Rhodococcus erythropolis]QEX10971.1 hypothetical protein F6X56_15210 [Rhodococcus erythropolis]